ncbi:hypothetical protein NP493_448g00000 [Ridgeia piscesae]|uniref:Uncharacterized protein n=1 Tax=Ridgeia piscesae TaxID=27915 RepID=A0AAD9KZK8_RIDPI|nr:hypothetical protein NP493_448g00000 [Ridgeia piscesae]
METRSATRRSVRLSKVKPPRPRRSISEPAPVPDDPYIKIIESLHQKLIDGVVCHTDVSEFLGHVNTNGKQMELHLKERLDGLFDVIRLSMVESEMEARARMHLLQLLELRASGWQTDDTRTNFYKSKCRCLSMKWRSNSDSSDMSFKKPSPLKPRRESSDMVTHDKAAGDTVTLSKTPPVFSVPDTLTCVKTSALYSAGEPQLSTSIIPSLSGLHRCSSVPSEDTKGSGFSRLRSLSDRRFPEAVAPPPWSCSSSVNELAHLGNDMRERTCSPSPEPDPDQECITYTGEALLAYAESPHARVPPQDWSYLSKVFPEVCHTQVDDYFHMSSYVPPQWNLSMLRHSTKRDVDVSSGFRGGFPCSKRQEGDITSASIRGAFPCSKRQDGDVSSTVSRGGFPCSKRHDVDVSSAVTTGGFPCNTKQDSDVSSTSSRGGFPCNTKQDDDVSSTVIKAEFPGSIKQVADISSTIVTNGGLPSNTKEDTGISSTVVKGGFPTFTKQDDDVTSTVVRGGFPGFKKQGVGVSSSLVRGFPGL